MDNPIEEKIQILKNNLSKKRGSGRTEKMLDEIVNQAITFSGQNIIVFGLTSDISNRIFARFIEKLPTSEIKPGNCIEVTGNLIMFKYWEYRHSTGYKYQTWDKEFHDNSITDSHTVKNIVWLEEELNYKRVSK